MHTALALTSWIKETLKGHLGMSDQPPYLDRIQCFCKIMSTWHQRYNYQAATTFWRHRVMQSDIFLINTSQSWEGGACGCRRYSGLVPRDAFPYFPKYFHRWRECCSLFNRDHIFPSSDNVVQLLAAKSGRCCGGTCKCGSSNTWASVGRVVGRLTSAEQGTWNSWRLLSICFFTKLWHI